MSEPRHATVWLIARLLTGLTGAQLVAQRFERDWIEGWGKCACDSQSIGARETTAHWAAVAIQDGRIDESLRITCDSCAIIVDAALEGVKPFPFSLPGVPDEVLR